MKIVADENIPLAAEWFAPLGTVQTFQGRELSAAHVADADIVLVRSVTRVDAALLRHSRAQFVGTCTIGTDQIDCDYLRSRGIGYANASGKPGLTGWWNPFTDAAISNGSRGFSAKIPGS